ncbi:MAG: HAD-IIB family hydrolase [Erysipelotrichaceae bacterium]|nr:HAD-IIB family hydrolase [Erysipelotrichaceae bacterium]
MIKLAVFDIDNTLIDRTEGYIRPSVIDVFEKLKKKGIYCIIATGRTYNIIQKEVLDLQYDYIICGNGTQIISNDKKIVYEVHIDKETTKLLMNEVKRNNDRMSFEFKSGTFNIGIFELIHKNILSEINLDKELPTVGMGILEEENVQHYRNLFPSLDFIDAGMIHHYDVVKKGENKKNSLIYLCEKLNIIKEEIIAVGDGVNDIEMIEYAEIGVAMGNACDELKKIADIVTTSVVEDGIKEVFEKLKII